MAEEKQLRGYLEVRKELREKYPDCFVATDHERTTTGICETFLEVYNQAGEKLDRVQVRPLPTAGGC